MGGDSTDNADPDHPATGGQSALIPAARIAGLPESTHVHQFNANAVRMTRSLGDVCGMSKLGIHLVRLEPGRESTQFHYHHCDEEFIYILDGHGTAEIGDERHAVGPGDFMGFTAPSLPHTLTNNSDADLVYLVGGERNAIDICDYPRIRQRMLRINGEKRFANWDDLREVAAPADNATDPR